MATATVEQFIAADNHVVISISTARRGTLGIVLHQEDFTNTLDDAEAAAFYRDFIVAAARTLRRQNPSATRAQIRTAIEAMSLPEPD